MSRNSTASISHTHSSSFPTPHSTGDYLPVSVEAEYTADNCDTCNCVNLVLTITDDDIFEEEEEFEISLKTDYFTFNVIPLAVAIQDNDGK